ncbi:class I SAM-dependent methyltransferase [Cellulophaga sp. 20_2_10]|uniref:class I SAM-dependent methyltransferase n=1 Tax=Cellulophaga sp. 20_2_10 TaxID=2942476 RepID=UPI00201AB213|nr:class I SAM-dependent methyltransferase [Cellulophaga sp. 20_2_10]MCL5245778.1 class I SAM-dependent methyltransferase [Cellulophaga sp. 20_2_10]
MKNQNQHIENHYHREGLYEEILQKLTEQHLDLNAITRANLAGVDEFHVRGAAVSKELAKSINLNNQIVLDVGCGLGGPCRMLADLYNCSTTGIDLSKEYIRTATLLSKLVGLDNKTTFTQGDATELPYKDNSFSVVWTQHVQMNIPNKEKLYSEINRVLKPGGHFLFYDIFKKGTELITYPMPWANEATHSFLFPVDEMQNTTTKLGLTKVQHTNQTQDGIAFFKTLLPKIKEFGAPKISLELLMGTTTISKHTNLLQHLQDNKLELISGVYKKQEDTLY